MKEVLWINTWFSSMAFVIQEIKKQFPDLHIIGTGKDEKCTYASFVDEYFIEPFDSAPKYIKFALDFCKQHNITILLPKSYSLSIMSNIEAFEELGVKVICEPKELLSLCRSKGKTYEKLSENGYRNIPRYRVVNSLDEFKQAYKFLLMCGNEVCVKYDKDEGAASFRKISNSMLHYTSLDKPLENEMTYTNMIELLKSMEDVFKFKPLMVMEVLSSPEVSVDCYNSPNKGFIAIPRFKYGERIKKVQLDKEIIEDAKRIQDILGFTYAFNVQYRRDKKGSLKLLEINTRISGGIHMSSLAGISIPNQLIADTIGIEISQGELKECTITQYEIPVLISEKATT